MIVLLSAHCLRQQAHGLYWLFLMRLIVTVVYNSVHPADLCPHM
nr:MAG TPA: hypothetical protein [Caudoviricetes sp.]